MKSREEILRKLNQLQDELLNLERKRDEELSKPIPNRSWRLFLFLNREHSAYQMAINEIEWILEN